MQSISSNHPFGRKIYRNIFIAASFVTVFSCAAGSSGVTDNATPERISIGKAFLRSEPLSKDRSVQKAPYRTEEMLKRAVPTNQWYSSIAFTEWSETIHAHPLTYKATDEGLEIGLPKKQIVPTQRKDNEVFYPHEADVKIAPTDFIAKDAKLAGYGDWNVDMLLGDGEQGLVATMTHGSPYAFFKITKGNLKFTPGTHMDSHIDEDDPRVLRLKSKDKAKNLAVFGPAGSNWKQNSGGDSEKPENPTYGENETLVVYDGRLDPKLNWSSYNPNGDVTVSDSVGDSVMFLDREESEKIGRASCRERVYAPV